MKRKRSQSELEPFGIDFRELGRRMFLSRDPTEIARLLVGAVGRLLGARRAAVFRFHPETGTLTSAIPESDPVLLPEKEVVEFSMQSPIPPVLPHAGVFLAVFPLKAQEVSVGIVSVDLTGIAEEFPSMNLEPVRRVLDQGAAALWSAEMVHRSQSESLLLLNILESITNGIITVDNDKRVTRLNRNAMAMLELAPDCLGRPYPEVLPPDIVRALEELARETAEMGFALEKVLTHKMSQGAELLLALTTSVLSDENYRPLGLILIFRDMTATRELDRLRRLDQMKSEFVANVSHELKTPLTSIKAYTEALTDMTADAKMQEFLQVINEESDRLLALINDLLNASRIQAGKMRMNFERCDPRRCVTEVLEISKPPSDRHCIVTEFADDLPEMVLDLEKMKEVLANLLSNAVKYSPQGGTVWVRMRRDEANLRIEVTDQGIGIPKDHLPHLFQAFYRVDSSMTTEIPGTGLGLVITEAIVIQHGGRMGVDSEVGKGSTFYVLIPIRSEAPSSTPGMAEPA